MKRGGGHPLVLALILLYAAALGWATWRSFLPRAAWYVLLGLNLATFCAYALDKRAARKGGWRIRERTLHLWSLAGGWPAGWWAQQVLRHKSAKASFRNAYWLTVLLHLGAVAGWAAWRLR